MYYFLAKLLPLLLLPPGLAFILVIAGLLWSKNNQKSGARLIWLGFIMLYVCSIPLVSKSVTTWWEGQPQRSSPEPSEVVVVLGGFLSSSQTDSLIHIGGSVERIFDGIQLLKEGKARCIVFSGGVYPGEARIPEAHLMSKLATTFAGVPDSVIITEERSANTIENARFTKQLLEEHNLGNKIILVTSASHMPRALLAFRHAGFDVQPVKTDFGMSIDRQSTFPFILLPSAGDLLETTDMLRHMLGYLIYRIQLG